MIPSPVLELTMEQELRMRNLHDAMQDASTDQLKQVADMLQRQVFFLQNTMVNLISTGHWDEAESEGTFPD